MSNAVSYGEMVLTSNGNKIIKNGANIFVTNQNGTSTRYAPYMELIIQINEGDTQYAIYNSFLKYTSDDVTYVETNDASQLIIPPKTSQYYRLYDINDKRYYTCDQQIYYGFNSTTIGPPTLYFHYKNNQKAILKIPNGNAVTPSNNGVYTINEVNRNTVFSYYSSTTVYILIDFDNTLKTKYGFSIFVMQSYCTQVFAVNPSNLSILGSLLEDEKIVGQGNTLPSNFVYSYLILDKEITLQVVSVGKAYLTQDGLKNSYIFLDPAYSNTIYEQYYQT